MSLNTDGSLAWLYHSRKIQGTSSYDESMLRLHPYLLQSSFCRGPTYPPWLISKKKMKMEHENKQVELKLEKNVKLSIRAELCYSNLNNVSHLFKFTICNLLFYMPNLDDDTPDPILEDYLQFNELRIYPNNFTLPRLMPEGFILETKQYAKLRDAFLNNDSVRIQIRFNYTFQRIPLPKTGFPKDPHF